MNYWPKNEAEFAKRLTVGIDSAKHQARVRAAGEDFIRRLEKTMFPFDQNWQTGESPNRSQYIIPYGCVLVYIFPGKSVPNQMIPANYTFGSKVFTIR